MDLVEGTMMTNGAAAGADEPKPLELFDLPELAQKNILSCLNLMDLMSLRLSCKTLNSWITTHNFKLLLKPFAVNENDFEYPVCIRISEAESDPDRSWKSLLGPGTMIYRTKIQKLKLNVDSESFYDDPEIQTFLQIYGPSIIKLKLNQFWVNSQGQIKFIESFPKLNVLKIDRIRIQGNETGCLFPKNLEKLNQLKFCEIEIHNLAKDKDYPYTFINKCIQLEALRLPKLIFHETPSQTQRNKIFRFVFDFCIEQEKKFGRRKLDLVQLKYINDLTEIRRLQEEFMLFLEFAEMIRFSLWGVSVDFFEQIAVGGQEYHDFYQIFDIRGFNVFILSILPLMELRRISIYSLEREIGRYLGRLDFPVMDYAWEDLEYIGIHYDIKEQDLSQPFVHSMMHFLFGNDEVDRGNLDHISVSFAPHLLNVTIPSAVFSARQITTYCRTINKLELINWNPGNKSFVHLWKGLPYLEELIIKNCPSLGNVGFIGENLDKPAFLELRSLEKLTLQLDLMPKVTERAFKDVFRHMKLQEFILLSEEPLQNIGANAINWLLKGPFCTKIRKFPFNTWSSASISPSQMLELKSQFQNLLY